MKKSLFCIVFALFFFSSCYDAYDISEVEFRATGTIKEIYARFSDTATNKVTEVEDATIPWSYKYFVPRRGPVKISLYVTNSGPGIDEHFVFYYGVFEVFVNGVLVKRVESVKGDSCGSFRISVDL